MQNSFWVNEVEYPLAGESDLPRGRRAISRLHRPAVPTDLGIVRRARWKFHGPIARSSREILGPDGVPGELGPDFTDDGETRFTNLLMPGPELNTITLSSDDPLATASAALGGFALGAAALGGGSHAAVAQNVSDIIEDRDFLFFARGAFLTQVDPADFSVIQTQVQDDLIRGMEVWFDRGYYGLGTAAPLRKIIALDATNFATAELDAAVFAFDLHRGSDRLFLVDGRTATEGLIRFTTVDPVSAASFSNEFVVGDPLRGTTKLGSHGAYAIVGNEAGIYGHTESGKPIELIDELRGFLSEENGVGHADAFGWHYVTTALGLYALKPSITDNPIGLTAEEFQDFEGFVGRFLQVFAWKGSVIASFFDGTTSRLLRGVFRKDGTTPGTGRLDWYPIRTRTARVDAIFGTGRRAEPRLIWGEGANAVQLIQGFTARDIAQPGYRFTTGGFDWFGQTMMRAGNDLINVRAAYANAENMESGDSFAIAVSLDEGAYVTLGTITANGYQELVAASGGVPLTTVNGHTLKPRVRNVAGGASSATSPPQLRGFLDVEYVQRPRTLEIVVLRIRATVEQIEDLRDLAEADTTLATPALIKLPDEFADRYAFVEGVSEITDRDENGTQAATLQLQVWPTG